ncbi:MAG: (2Fe-2S) ferredoxin domain-containing protein [Chloroflexota bacterium]
MSLFERHVFVCTSGEWCPTVDGDGLGVHAALKAHVAEAGLADRVRVNKSGCFSQCGNGPMVVVYPEGIWYSAVSPADTAEILERHLVAGEPVERLRFRPTTMGSHELDRDPDGRPIGRTAPWPTPGRDQIQDA